MEKRIEVILLNSSEALRVEVQLLAAIKKNYNAIISNFTNSTDFIIAAQN